MDGPWIQGIPSFVMVSPELKVGWFVVAQFEFFSLDVSTVFLTERYSTGLSSTRGAAFYKVVGG